MLGKIAALVLFVRNYGWLAKQPRRFALQSSDHCGELAVGFDAFMHTVLQFVGARLPRTEFGHATKLAFDVPVERKACPELQTGDITVRFGRRILPYCKVWQLGCFLGYRIATITPGVDEQCMRFSGQIGLRMHEENQFDKSRRRWLIDEKRLDRSRCVFVHRFDLLSSNHGSGVFLQQGCAKVGVVDYL